MSAYTPFCYPARTPNLITYRAVKYFRNKRDSTCCRARNAAAVRCDNQERLPNHAK